MFKIIVFFGNLIFKQSYSYLASFYCQFKLFEENFNPSVVEKSATEKLFKKSAELLI